MTGKVVRASLVRSVQVLGLAGMRDNLGAADCEMQLTERFLHVHVGELHTAVPLENVLFLWLDTPIKQADIDVGQSVGTNQDSQAAVGAPVKKARAKKKDAS